MTDIIEATEIYRHRGVTSQPIYGYEHNIRGSVTYTSTGEVVEAETTFGPSKKGDGGDDGGSDSGNMINGHEYVDLGLPSGTLWATMNIGATSSEEYGDYFAWGETETKNEYIKTDYKWYNEDTYTKYNSTDELTQLELGDDAAHVKWGGDWVMPTETQIQELIDNCTWTWGQVNGVNGYTISSINGNSIFLPTTGYKEGVNTYYVSQYGYYWSSSLNSNNSAKELAFYNKQSYLYSAFRESGRTIRPVAMPPSTEPTAMYKPITLSWNGNGYAISWNNELQKYEVELGTNIILSGFEVYMDELMSSSNVLKSVIFSSTSGVTVGDEQSANGYFNQGRLFISNVNSGNDNYTKDLDITVVFSDDSTWTLQVRWVNVAVA